MTTLGYARVSTPEQNLDLQIRALADRGVDLRHIFTDRCNSGISIGDRPGASALFASLQPGDVLVMWRLDRLVRGLVQLLEIVRALADRKIDIVSLTEHIDTCSASGQLVMQVFGALAEYERSQLKERVTAGVAAAKQRGVRFGRPAALSPRQAQAMRELAAENTSIRALGTVFKVSRYVVRSVINQTGPYRQAGLPFDDGS